uniref:Uncharacterized protein n=1 Tax=Rhizophora mucronata TaxID=61149 RepID=A0A2P2R0I9_RHIMU
MRLLNETTAHWSWHRNNDSDTVVADEVWLDNLRTSEGCRGRELEKKKQPMDEL